VAGVSGSFTAVTAITSTEGIVTRLTGTSDERLKDAASYEGGLNELFDFAAGHIFSRPSTSA
jgi:hypothetical protein